MKLTPITLAIALALAAPAALAAQTLTRQQALPADGEVEVSNISGSVAVTGWDKAEVQLEAVLEGADDQLEFAADDGRHLRIKVRGPGSSRAPKEARLTLRVPRGVALDVQAVSADVTVADVAGRQHLETVSGEVRTQAYERELDVRSVSGDVRVESRGGKAPATVETVSGNVVMDGIAGTVDAQAISGDLDLTLGTVKLARLKTVSGNVQAGLALAPSARVEVESVSGDVRLRFRAPVNAEFDLESFSGSLEACFGPPARRASAYAPGSELRFQHGDGSARVMVETLSGDATLCDK